MLNTFSPETSEGKIAELGLQNAGTIRSLTGIDQFRVAIVLGSGLKHLGDQIENPKTIYYAELQDFPEPSVGGHSGQVIAGQLGGVNVLLFSGRAHYYEQGYAGEMEVPIATVRALGADVLLLTNAAGSLDDQMQPGSVMLINDHINWSGMNPLIGWETDKRFVGLETAYDATMQGLMQDAAEATGTPLHEGVYMWFSGPSFETPAEIRMAQTFGAHAVGMSTVPEVILARAFGQPIAGLSLITNMGAGLSDERLSHEHTQANASKGAATMTKLVTAFVGSFA